MTGKADVPSRFCANLLEVLSITIESLLPNVSRSHKVVFEQGPLLRRKAKISSGIFKNVLVEMGRGDRSIPLQDDGLADVFSGGSKRTSRFEGGFTCSSGHHFVF
jgi:hypothetical protein